MDWSIAFQFVQSLGLPVALCLFFVWQSKINAEISRRESADREHRLVDRLEKMEDFQRSTLVDLARETAAALKENTVAINRFERCVKESWSEKNDRS